MSKENRGSLKSSFAYAFQGIMTCLKNERNIKIHCTMAALVVTAGVILRISPLEWCVCFTLFGLIMGLELVNTAVEAVVDLVTEERKPLAKIAKDTAAGAVLIASVMAAIAGLIIFLPKGIAWIAALLGAAQ
jgi:diacylglycerol kinase (ATP)